MSNDVQVSIVCNTYNHQKYIAQALDGFIQQEASFPFEVLIHDDASTDGTADIIRDYERTYPQLIKPIYQRVNQYSQHISINRNFQLPRAKGKYIAICEGDDYWTDVNKIQKQFEVLENNDEVDMCAHATEMLVGNRKKIIAPYHKKAILSCDEVILNGGSYLATNSLFYRRKMWNDIPAFYQFLPLDYSLQIWGALNGGIYYLPEIMSVYRTGVPNSWTMRMNSNIEKRKSHVLKVNEMLKILDDETEGRYSDSIKMHVAENNICILEWEKNYSDIIHGEYEECFRKLPLRRKTKIVTKQLLQKLGVGNN